MAAKNVAIDIFLYLCHIVPIKHNIYLFAIVRDCSA